MLNSKFKYFIKNYNVKNQYKTIVCNYRIHYNGQHYNRNACY